MNPEQSKQLIAACEAGDSVKAVTTALSIAATEARSGDRVSAVAIRQMVDDWKNQGSAKAQWRSRRLDIAAKLLAATPYEERKGSDAIRHMISDAEALMRANVEAPIDMDGK